MSIIGKVIGSITGANQAAKAGQAGAELQYQAQMAGVDEQRAARDEYRQLSQPLTNMFAPSIQSLAGGAGLLGADAEQQFVDQIMRGPTFNTMNQAGLNLMQQNASATGGFRGGNLQAAAGQLAMQNFNDLLMQRYGQIGGIASLGQNAIAQQGNMGMQSAANIGNLMSNAAAARAGGLMARGSVGQQGFGTLLGLGGMFLGAGGLPGLSKAFSMPSSLPVANKPIF